MRGTPLSVARRALMMTMARATTTRRLPIQQHLHVGLEHDVDDERAHEAKVLARQVREEVVARHEQRAERLVCCFVLLLFVVGRVCAKNMQTQGSHHITRTTPPPTHTHKNAPSDRCAFSLTETSLYVIAASARVRIKKSFDTPGWPASCTTAASSVASSSSGVRRALKPSASSTAPVVCVTSAACSAQW